MADNKQSVNTGSFANSDFVKTLQKKVIPAIAGNPDMALAGGIVLILALLIIPLPPMLLDFFLAINITISVMIVLIAVYLEKPLDFSAFPSVLLITTLFRLGLNVASTRLILGSAEAGDIIHAFGDFVIGGNYIVGIIIFLILLIINFIVIIKGSGRIAEVAARFTLDALPGKQMSIDADLNAGYIDEQTAKKRRQELTSESDFYGSMDGASKFIKGDAIAGIIITVINLLGGFLIGMLQLDMDFNTALTTYSILTIGDGLVSQIPSLLISVGGGLVVTRNGSTQKLDVELGEQFTGNPKPLIMSSAVLFAMAFLPGFPTIPFLLFSIATGAGAYFRYTGIKKGAEQKLKEELQEAEKDEKGDTEKPVEELLKIDPIEIELGYSLIAMVDETQGGDVFKRITNVRRQLATELGVIIPPVRVRDNLQLEAEKYVVKIRGNEIAENVLYPNMLLAMNPGTAEGKLQGINVTEPVFGLPATWIPLNQRENAEIQGYTVVEPPTVLTTHLTELLRRNSDKLLTRQDTKQLVDNLKEDYPALIEEVKPENLPLSALQKTLQNLLKEGIPIRDLPIIIESLLEYYKVTQNTDVLTEYVRHNMSDTIKKLFEDQNGVIHGIGIDPRLENDMSRSLAEQSNNNSISPSMGLHPNTIQTIMKSISKSIDEITMAGHLPTVICSAQIRPYFQKMIHTNYPMVSVISYTELPPDTEVEIHSQVKLSIAEPEPQSQFEGF
ncbi:flagellar biosynthesis protein FlhA [Candidatus Kapabacteria bacterium]|nr:flagellar biosynthesis protein FlhA [Candidatus Kapabacteria bacterium]